MLIFVIDRRLENRETLNMDRVTLRSEIQREGKMRVPVIL